MDEEKLRKLAEQMVRLGTEILGELETRRVDDSKLGSAKEFLVWYAAEYKRRYGNPYVISWGKEGALIKTAIRTIEMDDLKDRASQFLDSHDQFITKAGKTIGVFYSVINKYGQKKKSGLEGFLVE